MHPAGSGAAVWALCLGGRSRLGHHTIDVVKYPLNDYAV
jgi:hypothetical protein